MSDEKLRGVNVRIEPFKDQTTALGIDTIQMGKQALIFCSSKRGAESQAEKIAKTQKDSLLELSEKILHTLTNPTKQCKRLASCVKKGIAFHHAGLASKQRELVENHFRSGDIKIICSTPTLAAGLDMPAFRAIIRDTKRFGPQGMKFIPVLEYEQMSGRAGRPGKEDFGEAIIVANNEDALQEMTERYIHGSVEHIYSKLAVEPVLRTYVLSLVASQFITSTEKLYAFFDKTFYAVQYEDSQHLHAILDRMVDLLSKWNFLESAQSTPAEDFVSASSFQKRNSQTLQATMLGKRVSEIYIDPLTAHMMLTAMKKLPSSDNAFALVHLLSCTLEMRPLLSARSADLELIEAKRENQLLISEDDFFLYSQDDYENTLKTASFFEDWINELTEDRLLEKYNIRPGEINVKLQIANWLLYACEELARIEKMHSLIKIFRQARTRVKNGVKTELLPLLQFKGVGRSRARKLFNNGLKKVSDIVQVDFEHLQALLGENLAIKLKEQVGEKVVLKRQSNLEDFA